MGSRPAANPRYLKSGQLASFFKSSVFFSCFEERVFVGFESSVMFVAFLVMTSCTYDMPRSACVFISWKLTTLLKETLIWPLMVFSKLNSAFEMY
jgi:hypothetical protein